jgi:hypothetical protein
MGGAGECVIPGGRRKVRAWGEWARTFSVLLSAYPIYQSGAADQPMKSTETYAVLRQHLAPAFKAAGFKRGSSMLSWVRPEGAGHLVVWCQAAQSGWDMYSGSQFTMEFQRSAAPAVGAIPSRRRRLPKMLDDNGREEIRAIQNAVIAALRQPPPTHPLLNDAESLRDWYLRKFRPGRYTLQRRGRHLAPLCERAACGSLGRIHPEPAAELPEGSRGLA